MGFQEISSSGLLYTLVIIGLVYVGLYCGIFLKKAFARCVQLGMSKVLVKNVVKSSLVFSAVPSFAIVIGFFSLAAALGIPWSWWRLSVIGSVSYELMSADMTAKGMGYADLGGMVAANDPKVFGAVLFVMTIGIMAGMCLLLPLGKKLTTGLMKARDTKGSTWGMVMNSSFMLTLMAVFLPVMIFTDKISALTLATSAAITIGLSLLAKKLKAGWMNNFILAITLILGMAASVGWQNLLK